ncbi:MAG: V-type ATP synthase subunit E family protein [Methanomicrobiales archaeon]|nr:V-type ATP synthase subunit E family protein [Methanomicrobiales archaeon]
MVTDAQERIRELREKASAEAEGIKKEALSREDEIKKRYRENVRKELELERRRIISSVKERNRIEILRAKNKVLEQAYREAYESLVHLRDSPAYRDFLRRSIRESISELEGESIVIHADKRDEPLCREIIGELGRNCEIKTDLVSSGGVTASSADGRHLILNSIESRLERIKERMRPPLFELLFGE